MSAAIESPAADEELPAAYNGAGSPRSVRVPDELWAAARAKAEGQHRTITDVINVALRRYVYPPRRSDR